MKIWANTLVKNEDRFIWYAVMSVIDYIDRILIWDTGSTDDTVKIIREIKKQYPEKVDFSEVGEVDVNQFTVVRQKMLEKTKADWLLMLDGDEVWWEDKIKELRSAVDFKGKGMDSIVSRYYNVIGDIYHFQDETAGRYEIDNKKGNLTIRAFNRNIKGLKFSKPHGQQGIVDGKNALIQDKDPAKKLWLKNYSFIHFTNMQRSKKRMNDLKVPKRGFKLKYEMGNPFPLDFYYPEVFFRSRPELVSSVWERADGRYITKALVQTPLKKIKRKYISFGKSGY